MFRPLLAFVIRLVTGVRPAHHLPAPDAPRVYFANHSSHLDFVVLWAALPAALRNRTRPVAAADYWESGRIRRWLALRVFRALLIPRENVTRANDPIAAMVAILEAGEDIIIFPEGTRSLDGSVAPFKAGLHSLARRFPAAELRPVYLDNLSRILPKGEFFFVPVMGRAVFGDPCPGPQSGEGKPLFLERIRSTVLTLGGQV